MFIRARDLVRTLRILARNLDGTPSRYECVMTVKSQASGLQGCEGGPSVNRRLGLRWFEPNTCHQQNPRSAYVSEIIRAVERQRSAAPPVLPRPDTGHHRLSRL